MLCYPYFRAFSKNYLNFNFGKKIAMHLCYCFAIPIPGTWAAFCWKYFSMALKLWTGFTFDLFLRFTIMRAKSFFDKLIKG